MNRVVVGVVGLAAAAAVMVGCSDNKGGSAPAPAAGGAASQVSTGGKINVASGAVNGQAGLAVVMTDANPPTVDSLGMTVDGNALAVSNMGAKVGSADVKVDGSTYTITGQAAGPDMKNPMAGMVSKPFTIKVTCS